MDIILRGVKFLTVFLEIYFNKTNIYFYSIKAVSIGYNIIVFSMSYTKRSRMYKYDVINNHCCELNVGDVQNLDDVSCVKYLTS